MKAPSLPVLLSAAAFAVFLKAAVESSIGRKRTFRLREVAPVAPDHPASVSAVIPACNEERHIVPALQSVLDQDYPNLEVIAVNDRSSDRTGPILDQVVREQSRLRVVHIESLPADWLGKNHALHTGASRATGDWLLFADADVVMESSALTRAVHYATEHGLDHLAIAPKPIVGGFLAGAVMSGVALLFSLHTRLWKVRDPAARDYIGIGAFNLVRARAYRAAGGHSSIAMRPDDDLKLGKLLKRGGYAPDFVAGSDLLHVEWYGSFREMRSGLMKNLFTVLNYSPGLAVLACLAQFVLLVWPLPAAIFLGGTIRWLSIPRRLSRPAKWRNRVAWHALLPPPVASQPLLTLRR